MKNRFGSLCCILFVVLSHNTVFAGSLGLVEACDRAADYDAKYRSAEADHAVQKEEVAKARSNFRPSVRVSANRGRSATETTYPPSGSYPSGLEQGNFYTTQNLSVTIKQPLFNLSNISSYSQAKALASRSSAVLQGERLNLVVRTVEAYVNVLYAQDHLDYSRTQVDATKEQMLQAKKRFNTGFGTITEINEAQAHYDMALAEGIAMYNTLEMNKRELEHIIGVYSDSLKAFNTSQMVLAMPEPHDINYWIQYAVESNYEVLAAGKDIIIAEKQIDKSRAARYPIIDLLAFKTFSESESNTSIGNKYDTYGVSLQMNVPLYTGGYISSTVRQSSAQLRKGLEDLSIKERSVASNVRKYYSGIMSSIAQIHAYEQAVRSSEIALTGTKKGYCAGLRSNVDVLNAQRNLFDNKRNLAKSRYSYIINLVNFKSVCGILQTADIEEIDKWMQ